MNWAQIFIIFLAILLVVFIVAGIALAVSLFRVSRQLKAAAVRAERTVEDSAKSIQRSAVTMELVKGIAGQIKKRDRKETRPTGDDL